MTVSAALSPVLRVVPPSASVDLVAAERAAADLLARPGHRDATARACAARRGRMARAYAELFSARDRSTSRRSPTTRGTTSWCWPASSRCGRSASTTCCRSSASPTSATCPASGSSACPSWPGSSSHFAAPPAGAGAADHSRSPTGSRTQLAPARCRRRDRGRAPLHDAARGTGRRRHARSPRRCAACCATTRGRAQEFFALTAARTAATRHDDARQHRGRRRRRRPGRGQGRRGAARAGLRRAGHAARRRGRAALRAAAAVQGLPARQRRVRQGRSSTPRRGTPSTTSTCAAAPQATAIDRGAHEVELADGEPAAATARCCWPPAPSPRRLPMPGRRLTASDYLRTAGRLRPAPGRPSARASGVVDHRRRLDRPGGGRGRARGRRRRHRARGGRAAAAAACSARDGRRSSPTCTATHGVDLRLGASDRRGHRRPGVASTRGRHGLAGRRRRRRRRRRAQRPSSPRRPGSTSTTASWSTSRCAPATPTSTPPATSPTTTTRCSAAGSASSTGPTRSTSRPAAAAAMLGEDAAYDRLPYFFSDQYDLGMEYVGHATRDGHARVVVRGDVGRPRVRGVLARRPGPGPGRA